MFFHMEVFTNEEELAKEEEKFLLGVLTLYFEKAIWYIFEEVRDY